MGATCWPWVATRKALGLDPGGWAVIDPVTEWSMACNTPLWPLLGQTGSWIGLILSIHWSCQARAPICFIPTVLLNLHLQQVANPYLLGARSRRLRVNCVERIGIWPVLRTWNWQWFGNPLSTSMLVAYSHLNQGEWVSPLVHSQHKLDSVVEHRASKKYTAYIVSSNQETKWNLSESDLENEAADFPRLIVIESLEEVCLSKFSPFLIEKLISTRASLKTVKQTRNSNLLVEVDSRRQAGDIKNKNLSYDEIQSLPA